MDIVNIVFGDAGLWMVISLSVLSPVVILDLIKIRNLHKARDQSIRDLSQYKNARDGLRALYRSIEKPRIKGCRRIF